MRKSYHFTWNAAIDEYINSGVDSRPKAEIERQAKVGTWGGAFVRQCESEVCENLETDPGVAKMMQCSGCKIVSCSLFPLLFRIFISHQTSHRLCIALARAKRLTGPHINLSVAKRSSHHSSCRRSARSGSIWRRKFVRPRILRFRWGCFLRREKRMSTLRESDMSDNLFLSS